ncbi:MAG: hypothetical protein Kow006_01290 [Gammaproteobacteria bacterium]
MKAKQKSLGLVVALVGTLGIQGANAQQPATPPAAGGSADSDQSYAIKQSMDPNVWSNVMRQVMQARPASEICANCHYPETVARYEREYGAYMNQMYAPYQAMMNPGVAGGPMAGMMNPGAMMAPPAGMMNPMTMMNPMAMMAPMMMMGAPAMGMMNPGAMMNPMMGGAAPGMMAPGTTMPGMMPPTTMMDPKQYEQFFNAWQKMMGNMGGAAQTETDKQ